MVETTKSTEEELDFDESIEVDEPKKFKVLLHNDDYTTMEFVVLVLEDVFNKTSSEAQDIMLKVHNEGVGICGIYCFEVAETKVKKVEVLASKEGHPLKITVEEEE